VGCTRTENKNLKWNLPISANNSEYKWTRLIPYQDKPFVFNPTCGFVYNANQTPLHISGDSCNWSGDFPGLQRFEYNRGERFGEMLKSQVGRFSWDDFIRIKFDMAYSSKGNYAAKFAPLFNISETKYPDISEAIKKIKQWNHQGGADNKDAALAMLTHYRLMKKFKGPFAFLMIRDKVLPQQDAIEALRWAQKFMITYHGSINKPLGEVQQYIRGDVTMPAEGLYEVPRAADAKLYDKKKGVMRDREW
jgi:acyl-homoserine lactone acylase PvdQ